MARPRQIIRVGVRRHQNTGISKAKHLSIKGGEARDEKCCGRRGVG